MEALTAQQALDLARLISPAWREERGCVIRADTYEPGSFNQWWAARRGQPQQRRGRSEPPTLWDMLPGTDERDYGEHGT